MSFWLFDFSLNLINHDCSWLLITFKPSTPELFSRLFFQNWHPHHGQPVKCFSLFDFKPLIRFWLMIRVCIHSPIDYYQARSSSSHITCLFSSSPDYPTPQTTHFRHCPRTYEMLSVRIRLVFRSGTLENIIRPLFTTFEWCWLTR